MALLTFHLQMNLLAFILLITIPKHVTGFNQLFNAKQKPNNVRASPVTDEETSSTPLLDWNISEYGSSIGSLLMQMQKKEEEMKRLNKTLLDKEQVLDLDAHNNTLSSSAQEKAPSPIQEPKESNKLDRETAKELDDAVKIRLTSSVGSEVELLELSPLYKVLLEDGIEKDEGTELPPLSKPEHYDERIGRDMRHLAVSIASCVDDVSDWVNVCNEFQPTGGMVPLIQCIREGATAIRKNRDDAQMSDLVESKYEETFIAASTACRALRDLCALNMDLAAVITDSLLRANTACAKEGSSLLSDLVTLLQYAHDNTEIVQTSRRRQLLTLGRRKRRPRKPRRSRKETRQQCKLYVTQLLLAMVCASDGAVDAFRKTVGLKEAVLVCSSYARTQKTRRWLRLPIEMIKSWRSKRKGMPMTERRRRPFIEAASPTDDLNGKILGTSNQILAAIGYNQWVPKQPGQKGLRILCLDGGGSRGMTAVTAVDCLVESLGGLEVSDCFDFIIGTSTGAIIAFLIGLRRETSKEALARYDYLIERIFIKSAMSTPLMLFTTATYDESPFMNVLSEILGENTLLDSRADPSVPFVFGVTSKMSSNPTHVALLRNYNYNGGEYPDPFMVKPDDARKALGLTLDIEDDMIRLYDYDNMPGDIPKVKQTDASRHPGSFRVLQRYALRASTAAPTVFKPVLMGGEMYCDGGIVASNPTAIAIHEARSVFPDVPIECVVSLGTGGFIEQKSAPRIGWDGIIGQIVNSATDAEQVHHIMEDILGEGGTAQLGRSRVSNTLYARFNPILGLPDEFPIDVTDPEKLLRIKQITRKYMSEPEQQLKLKRLKDVIQGGKGFMRYIRR
eukprot:scaffold1525_cov142-Cylindrotheca_fusiformis.AAC.53